MSLQSIMTMASMVVYLIAIITIGIMIGRRHKNSNEFYIAGRGVGPWITAMSAEASDMSGWLLPILGDIMLSGVLTAQIEEKFEKARAEQQNALKW